MKNQKQTGIIIILGSLIALSPFSIDTYLSSFPAIAASLKTNVSYVGYSLPVINIGRINPLKPIKN